MTGLHVVSRSSAFALRGKTAREAGTALNADAMVEGTVGKVDERLRVTVSLVNVADEALLWSRRYDVTEKELYPLQDSAASAIASALGIARVRRDDAGLAPHRTENPEAHDLVLRGQFLTEQGTEAGLHEAIALFQHAAALDSTYADAWNGIAQAWFFLADTYMLVYGAAAWLGFRKSIALLALGWAMHPVWDVALHLQGAGAGYTPHWYPWGCTSFDLIVGGAVFVSGVQAERRIAP